MRDFMFELPETIILFDTEFTAWKGSMERGWSREGEYKEVVQIGAVRVKTRECAEIDSFSIFIRPRKNPLLSDYFVALTGITQEMLETRGVDFATALERFRDFSKDCELYSYGNDAAELEGNCELLGITFPFDAMRFKDIVPVFEAQGVPAKNFSSGNIMRAFNKEPLRTPHNGLHDARSILDGLRELKNRTQTIKQNT